MLKISKDYILERHEVDAASIVYDKQHHKVIERHLHMDSLDFSLDEASIDNLKSTMKLTVDGDEYIYNDYYKFDKLDFYDDCINVNDDALNIHTQGCASFINGWYGDVYVLEPLDPSFIIETDMRSQIRYELFESQETLLTSWGESVDKFIIEIRGDGSVDLHLYTFIAID